MAVPSPNKLEGGPSPIVTRRLKESEFHFDDPEDSTKETTLPGVSEDSAVEKSTNSISTTSKEHNEKHPDNPIDDTHTGGIVKAVAAKRPAAEETASVSSKGIENEESPTAGLKKQKTEVLDLAVTLGYQPGDRIEVQWEVDTDDGEHHVKWWGASLKAFDGRTEDSVAIRTLRYDPCPELGFPDPDEEDVIFLGQSLLVSPDSSNQWTYRRERGQNDVYWLNEDAMDTHLNNILMGALSKNEATWKKLPPSQQALIAEKIKRKKDELMDALRSKKEVITSNSIKEILKETFGASVP